MEATKEHSIWVTGAVDSNLESRWAALTVGQYLSQDSCFSGVAHSGSADGGAVPISGQVLLSTGALRQRKQWGSTDLETGTA